ncbi:hypothetical protein OAD66_03240 [Bacteroidia bacterium]|nr:hypothetical protein [Bacteroidia bacterium]MDB9882127.1 hypothetical protein [Bacteroidia bacterium]
MAFSPTKSSIATLSLSTALLGQVLRFMTLDYVAVFQPSIFQQYTSYILIALVFLLLGWSILSSLGLLIRFVRLNKTQRTKSENQTAILAVLALVIAIFTKMG